MKFIGEVKKIHVRKCKELNPEELLKCDFYLWRKTQSAQVCQWKLINGNCGHPVNREQLDVY